MKSIEHEQSSTRIYRRRSSKRKRWTGATKHKAQNTNTLQILGHHGQTPRPQTMLYGRGGLSSQTPQESQVWGFKGKTAAELFQWIQKHHEKRKENHSEKGSYPRKRGLSNRKKKKHDRKGKKKRKGPARPNLKDRSHGNKTDSEEGGLEKDGERKPLQKHKPTRRIKGKKSSRPDGREVG